MGDFYSSSCNSAATFVCLLLCWCGSSVSAVCVCSLFSPSNSLINKRKGGEQVILLTWPGCKSKMSSTEQMSPFKPLFSHMPAGYCRRAGSSLQTWPISGHNGHVISAQWTRTKSRALESFDSESRKKSGGVWWQWGWLGRGTSVGGGWGAHFTSDRRKRTCSKEFSPGKDGIIYSAI